MSIRQKNIKNSKRCGGNIKVAGRLGERERERERERKRL